jgi:FlaA1/EpsC-like NDP-sugar epimerase
VTNRPPKRVVIVGAGEAGRMLARELSAHAADTHTVAGFLDDALPGRAVDGHPVLGTCDALVDVVASENIDEAIIAVPSAGRAFVRRMVALCRDAGVAFRIVPGILEIIKGPVRLEQLRDARPEDLLGRESVEFDDEAIGRALAGRTVLVTGAGGSIGAEICRQIGRFELASLVLLGRGENQIYDIEQEMRERYPGLVTESVIADIRDPGAIARVFARCRPDFVYHAAAHKHVHYMEAFPDEAVKNNIIGTGNVIDAAEAAGVERLVMLSTDKAVNPRGAMGASKRFAEFLMMQRSRTSKVRLISVRFGNVLASRGSVVPLFARQIRAGGPVTVSHPEASRFFMSLREACMLVVQASLMGSGGEIYILQMGKPIRIVELARDLIALHGYRADGDIAIEYTGLRPGEKLHEDLVNDGEATEPSPHDWILRSTGKLPEGLDVEATVEALRRMAEAGDCDGIRRVLTESIPEADLLDTRETNS